MLRRMLRAHLAALVLLVLLLGPYGRAAAQGTVTWGEPVNLSSSPGSSSHPAITSDSFGYVHVFWSEDVGGQGASAGERGGPPNTIMYRRWDGTAWTEPLDVLAVAGDPLADFVAAAVDGQNRLHLAWTGLAGLYYSTAPAAEAHAAPAWSTPQVIAPDSAGTPYGSDVAVDGQGNVHIAYATRGTTAGVYHVTLPRDGDTWSPPIKVAGSLRANESGFRHVRLAVDGSDRLHAAWSAANTNERGQAVYYAHSEGAGETWAEPLLVADATIDTGFTGYPSLLPHGRDELLLIHVDQGAKGRIERDSADAGETWSPLRFILPTMEGVNGFLIPLLDGGGGQHLVINMQTIDDQKGGIYYAPRAGPDWAPVDPVAVDEPYGPSAETAGAAMRLGNEIHVVWSQGNGGEIWHLSGTINGVGPIPAQADPRAPAPAATNTAPAPAATPTPAPAATMVATRAQATGLPPTGATVAAPTPANTRSKLPAELAAPTGQEMNTWTPVLAAVIPVLFLLAGVAGWRTFGRRR